MQLTTTIRQINAENRQYLAVTTRENGHEVCHNTFTFYPDHLVNLEPQWMLDRAVPRDAYEATRGRDSEAQEEYERKVAELERYGQRLYGYLFGDGQTLANFLEFAANGRSPISFTLSMHPNAAPLWRLPWEYLHDGREFWGLNGRFHLSRRPHGLAQLTPEPVAPPVRILVIVSAPDDQTLLDIEEEIGVLQEALDETIRTGQVVVEYVEDATLLVIGEYIRKFDPHVIHYTGHGKYDEEQERSYLALEDENWRTRPAGITELKPHLTHAHNLRLVVLSGCQTAQTSAIDAFRGVATGLLDNGVDVPAVLAMQFAILDNSAIQLAGAFYGALAHGDSLPAAFQAARLALAQYDEGPGYDWGIPALYQRAPDLRLVDPDLTGFQNLSGLQSPAALVDMHGLPLPRHFVGRITERKRLRKALRDNRMKAVFVRGIGGIGKSSVAAKLIERPGIDLDGVLTIRCHEVDPLDISLKLASFLQGQGQPGHAEAGAMLMDSRLDPKERAQEAARLVANRRYLIVFDNFESVMAVPGTVGTDPTGTDELAAPGTTDAEYEVDDPVLRGLLAGLVQANWRSLCLFTGRYRWRDFGDFVARNTADEIHMPQLTRWEAVMLMNNLPRLRPQPVQTKIALFQKVGGHPKTLELLNGWLTQGRIDDLLADPALDNLLAQEWEDYFLRDLLAQLSDAEREKLARLAIFQAELDDEALAYAEISSEMERRWLDLSLLHQVDDRVLLHPVVAEYLLGQTDEATRRDLYHWAVAYYGWPFVEQAREHGQRTEQNWSSEQIEWFARDRNGVIGYWIYQTQDMVQAQSALARVLDWQRCLFAAGDVDAAGQIISAVYEILARWGHRDKAKSLLRRSVETLEGFNKAVTQGNLANLLMEEGKLDEALVTYQAVYDLFAAQHITDTDARQQMAATLTQMSEVYRMKGELETSVAKQEANLHLWEEIDDELGQAICLHQLSILYWMQADYPTALARSQAAEKLNRKRNREHMVAGNLHEQGLIYTVMARTTDNKVDTDEQSRHVLSQQAWQCLQESLAIKRRIGDDRGTADTLNELGKLLLDSGQIRDAITAFNGALTIYRRRDNPIKAAIVIRELGIVHEMQGEYLASLTKYQEALTLFQQYGSPQDVVIVESDIVRVHSKL